MNRDKKKVVYMYCEIGALMPEEYGITRDDCKSKWKILRIYERTCELWNGKKVSAEFFGSWFIVIRMCGPSFPKHWHSRLQRPHSFWSAPRIATSGPWQARSNRSGSPWFTDFPSLCVCSGSSLTNLIGSGLHLLCGRGQRSRFLVLTKRSALWGRQ